MTHMTWCPIHSSLSSPTLFGINHPCFTVYDAPQAEAIASARP